MRKAQVHKMRLAEGYAEELRDVPPLSRGECGPGHNLGADCGAGVYPTIRRISDADPRTQCARDRCG